ncbi:hypothetical protein, partial [Chlamydiifrater volucris]|uniref:hypothetical protein n=1 Tax=Chlamydiifrater volucris TaxID=2681470 RepID=UPI0032B16622
LTSQELDLVLASCRDLTEASGSGSSSQSTTQSMKRKQLEEEISHSPSPKRSRLLQESTFQIEDVPTEPVAPQHAAKESLRAQSINCLLATALRSKGTLEHSAVMCPKEDSNQRKIEHLCEICSLTKRIVKNNKYLLIFQLQQLMETTNREAVLKALLKLYEEGKLSELEDIFHFSHLEIAHLVKECNVEKIFQIPKKATTSELLNLYQVVKNVVALGIKHPLTTLIIQLWNSTILPKKAETVLTIASESGEETNLSHASLLPTFCSIPRRKLLSRWQRCQNLPTRYSAFLSKITIATLQAIKNSSQGDAHMITTRYNKKAFLWKTVHHTIGLILSSNDEWVLQTPTNKLCFGSPEEIRFSEEECSMITTHQRQFALINRILYPQLEPPISQNLLFPKESYLLSTPSIQLKQKSLSPIEQKKVIHKTSQKASYEDRKASLQKFVETISYQASPDLTPEKPVIFMLEAILSKRPRATTIVRCPNEDKDVNTQHLCSLCLFAKWLFSKRKAQLITQFQILLGYTKKETLAPALLNLPLGRTIEKLLDQTVFSPLDLAYLINLCNIGEDMRLPEKKNPAALVDLYHSMEKVILGGLEDPLTKIIHNIWKQSSGSSLSFKEKEEVLIEVLWGNDAKLINLQVIINYFSDLEFQILQKRKSKVVRKQKKCMTPPGVKFHSLLAIITLQELKNCEEAYPYLMTSLRGCIIPKATVLHVYSLILSSNPRRNLVITPNKASLGQMQELAFPEEVADVLSKALQEFATRNHLSIHSLKKLSQS